MKTETKIHLRLGEEDEKGLTSIYAYDGDTLLSPAIATGVDAWAAKDIVRRCNAHDDLVTACKFLMSQVERLAQVYMSEGAEEWILKNDAMNCGRRALDL